MQDETMELETETAFSADFGAMDTSFADEQPHQAFEAFTDEPAADATPNLDVIMNIPVTMQVVLGSTVMPVANLMKLGRGAVVKLDTNISDPVDLIVNGRIVARGEVVVLENEDSRFGITLTEIVSPTARQPRSKTAAV